MEYLFDSKGNHIANLIKDQLHAPNGQNIGHFLEKQGIFIDMSGRYMGEVVHGNRLMYNRSSPHRSVNYGSYGNYGSVGSYGSPGSSGSIGAVGGYSDIETPWL